MVRNRAAFFLAALALFPAVLLGCFDRAVLDVRVHWALYDDLGSAQAAGLTREEAQGAAAALVDYIEGRTDSIDAPAQIDGRMQSVFNAREAEHMRDVRVLFVLERRVMLGLALFAALSLCMADWRRRDWPRTLLLGALTALGAWAALLAAVAVWAALDFNALFLCFHRLLFTNDLWLLDPATDRMICLMPQPFFEALALRAARWMGWGALGACALMALPCTVQSIIRRKRL